jgi:hypothetical protein
MRELLTVPLPPADDLSTEAQSKRELLLLVAETAIGHARKAEEIMLSAVVLYRNIPVEYIVSVDKPLIALQFAVKSKDGAQLERGFADLTTACNNCHQAAQAGFISIQTPTSSPFSDQNFLPTQK